MNHFQSHIHFYWSEALLDPSFPRSQSIENWLLTRVPFFKKENAASRIFNKLGVGRWTDDIPSAGLASLLTKLRPQLSSIYLAPIDAKDAIRMKAIVTTLQMPFVVHLWDFLDNSVNHDATRWLIANANHVFCLNRSIIRTVRDIQPNSSILTFTRPPAKVAVKYPPEAEFTVAMLGDIGSYRDGVQCLVRAVKLLRRAGHKYRILYIGRKRVLRQCGFGGHEFLTASGFFSSGDERDRVLSRCSLGFLPGPIATPEHDARSRYSIPSRILDFLAVGLPFVGTVNQRSATYEYCRDLGIECGLLPTLDSKALARALMRMASQREWADNNRINRSAFDQIIGTHQLGRLKEVLQKASR